MTTTMDDLQNTMARIRAERDELKAQLFRDYCKKYVDPDEPEEEIEEESEEETDEETEEEVPTEPPAALLRDDLEETCRLRQEEWGNFRDDDFPEKKKCVET